MAKQKSDFTLKVLGDLLDIPVEKAFAYGIGAVGAGFAGGTFYINKVLIEPALKSSEASTNESINLLKKSIDALKHSMDSMDWKLIGLGVGLGAPLILVMIFQFILFKQMCDGSKEMRDGFSKGSEEMRNLTREVATTITTGYTMAMGLGVWDPRASILHRHARRTDHVHRAAPVIS
jgi:hypothetical protein